MASQYSSNASLPQGFSVYQPTLGMQLQFFPALGSQELDDMMNAYVPGPASIKEKRASISLDFLEHAQMTGQTFKFYPVYSPSPVAASPVTSVSSFNVSPVNSTWDFSHISGSASVSSRSSTQSRKHSKANSSASRQPTADFSHIPGMKIMTKEGLDVTNSASRGSKTKEQRDHAHLMRIIKACDSCRRKKVRCDPSHKKRSAPQTQSQPAAKPAKKARTVSQKPATVNTPAVDDALRIADSPVAFESTFSFAGLEALDNTVQPCDLWEEFVQYPPVDADDNYDFFLDPSGYLSSQSPSSSSPSSPQKSLTPSSLQESLAVPGLDGQDGLQASPQLPYLDQSGSFTSYTDFSLFSPESTFSEDDHMVSISSSRHLSPTQLSDASSAPGIHESIDHGQGGMTSWNDWSAAVSPLEMSGGAQPPAMAWYDPGDSPGLQPIQDWSGGVKPAQVSSSLGDIIINVPDGGTVLVQAPPGVAGVDRVMNNVSISSSDAGGSISISVESDNSVEITSQTSRQGLDRVHSEPSVENISRPSLDEYYGIELLEDVVVQGSISGARAASATARPSSGNVQDNATVQRQQRVLIQSNLISATEEASYDATSRASCPQGENHNNSTNPHARSVGVNGHTTIDAAESPGVLDEAIQEPFNISRMASTTTNERLRSLVASDNCLRRGVGLQPTSLLQDVMNDVRSLLQVRTAARSQPSQGIDVRVRDKNTKSAQGESLMIIPNAPTTIALASAVVTAAYAWNMVNVIAGPSFIYTSTAAVLAMAAVLGHVSSTSNTAIASNVGKFHSLSPSDENNDKPLGHPRSNGQTGFLHSWGNKVSALRRGVSRLSPSYVGRSLLGSSSMSSSTRVAVSVMG
ncbi:hypothetical protein PT974_01428 [Cladobotryum mycophilum]|uniref:Transcription factor n=1 Tax=Cladobotryum mycophilum TaxID=491253 RepID=A0ABR0T3M8_9HYPO